MNLKKIFVPFLSLLFALVIPFSSVFADSAGWQVLTSEKVHYNKTLDSYITGVDNAHASGYIKVCNWSDGGRYFYIKEYDPDKADNWITYAYLGKNGCNSWNIQDYVDGSNKKAEIYIQTSNSNSWFIIYD
ncbi:hypothetical protein SAMN05444392_104104 [Seinonella peptonophila]|uniref:Uncharacterized protein n=1 Tax=Seinonella peptonophila TaxID=112248 RepID=A0A1M4X3F8_9BACL|nr:hypothetical protein [Seinonella peptonophila]SHE88038.1 hypothetical protein SAMN05444392_104104 [Seinonella peptonophila]